MDFLIDLLSVNIYAVIYASLSLFGIPYAMYIFNHPTRRVWVSVVIGNGTVCIGLFVIIIVQTENIWLALAPFFANLFAGWPQIVAQEVKKYHTEALAQNIIRDLSKQGETR